MDADVHARELGGLVGNLQSLELFIRLYLAQRPGSPVRGVYGDDVIDKPVGTLIEESDMSNYASLKFLIKEFNKCLANSRRLQIDEALVDLRDALAHGRVFSTSNYRDFRLIKFDRPENGYARISYSETMSLSWFLTNKQRVSAAIDIVATAYKQQEEAASHFKTPSP